MTVFFSANVSNVRQFFVYLNRKSKAIDSDQDTASFQGQLVAASYQVACKDYDASAALHVVVVELLPIQPEIEV